MSIIEQVAQWGKAKSRTSPISEHITDSKGLFHDLPTNTFQKMYGQDGIAWLFQDKIKIYANADGHGIKGEQHAKYALRLIPHRILEKTQTIRRLYKNGQYQQIENLMETIYCELDAYLNQECPYTKPYVNGGCTMTTKLMFPHPKQPWKYVSVTTNTGDSIAAVVQSKTYRMFEETQELNADSFEAWTKYAQMCHEEGFLPKKSILGRFNVRPNTFQVEWAQPKVDGVNQPIEPFVSKIVDDKIVTNHNTEVMEKFYTNVPHKHKYIIDNGGTQSYRGRKQNLTDQEDGLFPAHNFGCTLEGIVQCLPSFGDVHARTTPSKHDSKYIAGQKYPKPEKLLVHTNIRTVHKTELFLIGSDGLFDVLPNQDIVDAIKRVESMKKKPTPLDYQTEIIKTMDHLSKTIFSMDKHLLFPRSLTGDIAWDDVSCITGIVTIVKPNVVMVKKHMPNIVSESGV